MFTMEQCFLQSVLIKVYGLVSEVMVKLRLRRVMILFVRLISICVDASVNWLHRSWSLSCYGFVVIAFSGSALEPLLPLAFFPDANTNAAFLRSVCALTIHFAKLPGSVVSTSIRPLEHTLALLVVVNILALIFSSIRPCENAITMHFVLIPVAVVSASVFPGICTLSMNIVLVEFAIKLVTIVPLEETSTML